MARFAPLITLGAVAALGGTLLVVNTLGIAGTAADSSAPQEAAVAAPANPGGAQPAPPAADPPAPPAADPPAAVPALGERAYAGRSAGKEVTVAIAVRDGRAIGYVCDGDRIEAWLEGTVENTAEGAALSLSGADGKATITGTATETVALGTVAVAGRELPFSAKGVEAPAGLYEGRADVRGVATRIGWIVTDDGEVTGIANEAGRRGPAPVLDPENPGSVTIDGVPVTVSALDGGDRVIRR
jgi:hypothetical protein